MYLFVRAGGAVLIKAIMKTRVATVEMDDSLALVRELFLSAPFHHLLVVEGEELVGILSDKDLFRALSPYLESPGENQRDRDTLSRRVHQVMTREVITISADASLELAANLMLDRGISCLPVLEDGKLQGVITWRDLLKAAHFR